MKKRESTIFISVMVVSLLLIVPLASAGFFSDAYDRLTGWATQDDVALTVTVGNTPPTIPFVEAISAQDPVEAGTRSITFTFTAEDDDGVGDLNDDTAKAYFQKTGETTRFNETCSPGATSGNQKNYTCTIDMWYFDEAGSWTINVTIKDNSDAYAENSSTTFTYQQLTAMVMSPTSLTWPEIGPGSTDVGSNNDPTTLNNTGNAESLDINVTAIDLQGETNTDHFIFANNFTIDNVTDGCEGTVMVNDTSTKVANALLGRGNNTAGDGQETTFYCIKGLPEGIVAQEYSTTALGAWTVEVIS